MKRMEFGGAVTEATAYNFARLSAKRQREFLRAYFGKNGLNYDWVRISIGSNDFCLSSYEYTKRKDLRDFSIERDREYIIPMLKKILEYKDVKVIASPWSPPSFMKTNGQLVGGKLKRNHYKIYAQYIRKWLKAYAEEGIKVGYITPQNEPEAEQRWESCVYNYRQLKRLIYKHLVPALRGFDTKILIWDHNKEKLSEVAHVLLDGISRDKIAGIAFHWYKGIHEREMRTVRRDFPELMMVASEMCCGFSPYDKREWQKDAELYIRELQADKECGVDVWIDWNMLLDWEGGPTHVGNNVKSPVILNERGDDFILTPIYDALLGFVKEK